MNRKSGISSYACALLVFALSSSKSERPKAFHAFYFPFRSREFCLQTENELYIGLASTNSSTSDVKVSTLLMGAPGSSGSCSPGGAFAGEDIIDWVGCCECDDGGGADCPKSIKSALPKAGGLDAIVFEEGGPFSCGPDSGF